MRSFDLLEPRTTV